MEEAKKIALNKYKYEMKFNKTEISFAKHYSYKSYHLIESKGLSKKEIECFLNESNKYIEYNKNKLKKTDLLKGRTVFNPVGRIFGGKVFPPFT